MERREALLCARLEICPVLDEHLYHLRMMLRGRPHQRGLLRDRLFRVYVSAGGQQHPDRVGTAGPAQVIIGVSPVAIAVLALAPPFSSLSTSGALPFVHARDNGVTRRSFATSHPLRL